jgi:hypothetical protein
MTSQYILWPGDPASMAGLVEKTGELIRKFEATLMAAQGPRTKH